MRRIVAVAVAIALCAFAALGVPSALGAERMWIGFHDDPSFRWARDSTSRIESSATTGANVMRLLVHWDQTAPQRPAKPADPFDAAYRLDDLDAAIRAAQRADLEVLLTLYGTPRWANGGRGPNVMPRRVADFRWFSQAIASRYSGRHEGYPHVRFWSVWNEPNLQRFLSPQFDRRGKPLAPKNYAVLYAAAHAGIKTGSPDALVAIGETSPRGSDNPKGSRAIHSPGKFAELVAKANPRLKFDAWAHHPYPSVPSLRPSQKVRWPNVSLASLPLFHKNLKKWFKRSNVSIWVTEYAHQTKPQERFGVTYAKQAEYVRQAIAIAKKQPFVTMFVWFVYRDDPGQEWDSGLYTQAGAAKGASPVRFAGAARPVDARNAVARFPRGATSPRVTVHARRYCGLETAPTTIAVKWQVSLAGRVVGTGEVTAGLRPDCTLKLRLPGVTVAKGKSYAARFDLDDLDGTRVTRQLTLRGA